MKKYSARTAVSSGSTGGEQGFWPSYADMMSAVALILFFLMLLAYIQNLITGNSLQNTQEVLENTRLLLVQTEDQVKDAEAELDRVNLVLNSAKQELEEQTAYITTQQEKIDEQDAVIATQNIRSEELERYLASTQAELTELRGQMQTIAVLRLSILEQIRDSITRAMGSGKKVTIGDNGTIILSESILFDFGSAEVKAESRQMLDQLSEVFVSFLSDNENAKYVDSIVISGHTDNRGTEAANRSLSTDRANSVLTYLLQTNSGQLSHYSRYFCAAGYGATRPVASNATDAGRSANRRIEISMILKDESVLQIVDQYLAIEMPESTK